MQINFIFCQINFVEMALLLICVHANVISMYN